MSGGKKSIHLQYVSLFTICFIWVYVEVEGSYRFYCGSLSNVTSYPFRIRQPKQTSESIKRWRVVVDTTCTLTC